MRWGYAMVLAVGQAVGMSLVGMFCAALRMISKAVSSPVYRGADVP